jgi:hypothetical protein
MAANAGAGGPPGTPPRRVEAPAPPAPFSAQTVSRVYPAGAGTPVSPPDSGFVPVPEDLLRVNVNKELTMDQLRTLSQQLQNALETEGREMMYNKLREKLEEVNDRLKNLEISSSNKLADKNDRNVAGGTLRSRRRAPGKSSNSTRTKRRHRNQKNKKTLKRRHNRK